MLYFILQRWELAMSEKNESWMQGEWVKEVSMLRRYRCKNEWLPDECGPKKKWLIWSCRENELSLKYKVEGGRTCGPDRVDDIVKKKLKV